MAVTARQWTEISETPLRLTTNTIKGDRIGRPFDLKIYIVEYAKKNEFPCVFAINLHR